MAENRQAPKSRSKRTKWTPVHYVLAFFAGAALGLATICFVQTRQTETGLFFGGGKYNTERETNAATGNWAKPLELPGVPNLHKVSDNLYRGAQADAEGMRRLKKLGVKTVVNLRSAHSDRAEIGDTALAYEHVYMKPWHPEDKEVVRFLQIVTDPNCAPVFVHCQRGADRTGTMCAIYRIAVQGWSKTEAIEEMTKGGFGFYSGWDDLVEYVRNLNVDEIKTRARLKQ